MIIDCIVLIFWLTNIKLNCPSSEWRSSCAHWGFFFRPNKFYYDICRANFFMCSLNRAKYQKALSITDLQFSENTYICF